MTYQQYLQTDHWKSLRTAVLQRDGFKCTRCPCRRFLQVHHVVYRTLWIESKPEDLVTLCEPCHARHHNVKSQTSVVFKNGGVFRPKGNPLRRKKRPLTKKEIKLRKRYAPKWL